MTTSRQVLHVAAKDLRVGKPYLLAYGLMVSLSAIAWLAGLQRFIDWSMLWGLLTLLAAMYTAALLVLEDTPARGDLLWSTLPLSATAVLAAKLLVVLVFVITPTLAAQAIVLTFFDVGTSDVLRSLSVSLAILVVVLLFAMVLGSLSRDARLLAVLLTVLPIAFLIAGNIVWYVLWGGTETVPGYSAALVPVLVLSGLLVHQYRSRRTRRTALLFAAALVTSIVWPARAELGGAAALSAPGADGPRVRIASIDTTSAIRNGLAVLLEMDGGDGRLRYDIHSMKAHLVDAAGRRDSVGLTSPHVVVQRGVASGLEELQNLTVEQRRLPPAAHVFMSDAQRAALATGEAQLELTGMLIGRASDPWAAVPLSSRARIQGDGKRLWIRGAVEGTNGPELDVELMQLGGFGDDRLERYDGSPMDPLPRYLLVSRERGEYALYSQAGSSGSSLMVIVPGARAYRARARLQQARWNVREAQLDPDWVASAELMVVDWNVLSSQPIRLRASMRLPH